LTVSEGSISCSVQLNSVKNASLVSISCGWVSSGHCDAQQCHPCSVGPAINFTVSEGSISCSVQWDSVKKASHVSVSRASGVCGLSNAHGIKTTDRFQRKISQKCALVPLWKKVNPTTT
jgi:hypothetical protein